MADVVVAVLARDALGPALDGRAIDLHRRAARPADEVVVVGLTGRGGGKMSQVLRDTDVHICVPHERTARIQEVHILALHCICDAVDAQLLGEQETNS